MTEKECWFAIAEAFDRADERGRTRFGPFVGHCICGALNAYLHLGIISIAINNSMRAKVQAELDRLTLVGYLYLLDAEGAKLRAAFCRKQAEECGSD